MTTPETTYTCRVKLHHKINVRGHLNRYGMLGLNNITRERTLFVAYRCTGKSALELASSPHPKQTQRLGRTRRYREHLARTGGRS